MNSNKLYVHLLFSFLAKWIPICLHFQENITSKEKRFYDVAVIHSLLVVSTVSIFYCILVDMIFTCFIVKIEYFPFLKKTKVCLVQGTLKNVNLLVSKWIPKYIPWKHWNQLYGFTISYRDRQTTCSITVRPWWV